MMGEKVPFVTEEMTNVYAESGPICGNEPLPEPYESAARMVYGDRPFNDAFIAKRDLRVGSLHRWRQHPEMIARVRFLARSHRHTLSVSPTGASASVSASSSEA